MRLVDPLMAFVIAYTALVILSMRGAKAYTSIAAMILVYAVFTARLDQAVGAAARLAEWNDARVFVYIFLSLTLAGLMREKGLLDRLVEATSALGCRFSLTSVPAIIGLIPMPGGALVSAIALKKKFFDEARLGREEATFINYWFRHIWVPSWPLFQSVVITASVFALDPIRIVSRTWPATPAAIIGGIIVAAPLMRGISCGAKRHRRVIAMLASSLWPLLLLAGLFIASRTSLSSSLSRALPGYAAEPMLASLAIVILLFTAAYRPSLAESRRALGLAIKPTIHAVLLESLYFKNLIIATGAGQSIKELAGQGALPLTLLAVLVPFILGLAAGGENFFASTAMPLLYPYIAGPGGINWYLLSMAYLGGFLGVMASPVHLCLVLTSEYYKSRMSRVLAYVTIAVAASLAVGAIFLRMAWA